MQLSVIILNYNVRYFLELCVLSVQNAIQNIDAEIIVIDNNSSDGSCEMIKENFPNVTLIQNSTNVGFPKGNNIGVSKANGEYLCILNPDTVVAEDTFEKLLDFAQKKDNLGIVGCKLIDGKGKFLPESKRGVPTPWVAFTKIVGLYKLFPKSNLFNKYYAGHLFANQTGEVDILVGAFMVLKRDFYVSLGGFDEDCFMYSDDIDLSYMSIKSGKQNFYYHNTTAIHYKGESTVKDGKYMKRFQEAMTFFYKKHFKVSLVFSIFMNFGIVFFSALKMLQGHSKNKEIPQIYLFFSDKTNEYLQSFSTTIKQDFFWFESLVTIQDFIKNQSQDAKIEVVFDNNFLNFTEIIMAIESLSKANITFKILPKNSNYIIGSNSSIDRGEVLFLS
jgi:GT2 family glycosyltransferase